MAKNAPKFNKNTSGFTLVELAIALTVIGLLIGGVLKGQELVENARITRTLKDLKSFETATRIFQDAYAALPGDIPDPGLRIPGCSSAPCNIAGDNNKQVGPYEGCPDCGLQIPYVMGLENRRYWLHLANAGLLGGIDGSGTTEEGFGVNFPEAPVGGGYILVYIYSWNVPPYPDMKGHYIRMTSDLSALMSMAPSMKPRQAMQIDSKLDDGLPLSGDVISINDAWTGTCLNGAAYNELSNNQSCGLTISMNF